MEKQAPLKRISVFAHVLENTADAIDTTQLLLSRLSERCNHVAYGMDMEQEMGLESVAEAIGLLYELKNSLCIVSSNLESRRDFLHQIVNEAEPTASIATNATSDVSCDLAKIESLARSLEKDLFERARDLGDGTDDGEEMEGLYWTASTIRETACKVSGILYPAKPLN